MLLEHLWRTRVPRPERVGGVRVGRTVCERRLRGGHVHLRGRHLQGRLPGRVCPLRRDAQPGHLRLLPHERSNLPRWQLQLLLLEEL